MRRSTRRQKSRFTNRFRPRPEALEARLLLVCEFQQFDNGTLQVTGDDTAEVVEIADLGRGEVSVLCQNRGDDRTDPLIFNGVTALEVDLAGGDDELNYTSIQDVNAALPRVDASMGDGNDTARIEIDVDTKGGDDSIWLDLGFPIPIKIDVDAGSGADDVTIKATAPEMINRISDERDESRDGLRLDVQVILGVGDDTASVSGVGFDQAASTVFAGPGDDVVEIALLLPAVQKARAAAARTNVNLDVGPNIILNLEDVGGTEPERGKISVATQPTTASLSLENLELTSGLVKINAGGVRAGGVHDFSFQVGNTVFREGGSFVSEIVGGRESNRIVSRLKNVTNRGDFRQSIDTGGGRDVVVQSIDGFQNYGTAVFDTQLGRGADRYLLHGRNIFVAAGASLDVQVDGDRGRDRIFANIAATVKGEYRFAAHGGRGADTIGVVHQLRTNSLERGDDKPAIDLLVAGGGGHDRLAMWLFAPDLDEELIDALIDGGRGIDRCFGNVDAVNCER